jgi:hypothetical protein
MTFQLTKVTAVKLLNINVRREIHGDEHVPAMDLSMRLEGNNELLDLFDPALRLALYFNAAAKQGQETLPEVLQVLPNLRMPKLNNQKFGWAKGERHKGYRMVLDYGMGDEDSNVDLDDCTVTNWRIGTKEGGTVVLEWVVQYAGEKLTSEVRGKLTGLTDEMIHVQIIAPPVLQIVKGKDKPTDPEADDDGTGSLLDDGDDEDGDSPEKALMRANGSAILVEPMQ